MKPLPGAKRSLSQTLTRLPRESLGLLLIFILMLLRRAPPSIANSLFNLSLPTYLMARRNHVRQIAARWGCMPGGPPFSAKPYYRKRWQLFLQALRDHGNPYLPEGVIREGREHLVKALATGKPLLIAGIHLGPFEWLHKAPYRDVLAANRIYRVVTAPTFSTLLNRYVTRGREAPGKEIVFNHSLSKAVKQTLREGGVLACMLDQNPDWLSNPLQCWDRLQVPAADKLLEFFVEQGGVVLPIAAFKDKEGEGRLTCHPPLKNQANSADNGSQTHSRKANGRQVHNHNIGGRDVGGCDATSNFKRDDGVEGHTSDSYHQWLRYWLEDQIQAHPWEYNWSYPGLGPRLNKGSKSSPGFHPQPL